MDKSNTTPKDFFLWAGAMVAFYWSVIAGIFLVFDYINYIFPNALDYYPSNPYQSGISYEMASVIVLVPIYILLMWAIRKDAVRDPSRNGIWVRRWALILTLFVAGATIAADLITLLTTFLNGEALTAAFLLKVFVIFVVALKTFVYFIADLKGYWERFPARRRAANVGGMVLAAVVVVAGFFIVGTPAQARLAQFDEQKVGDLQNIQSRVVNYWQTKQKLPAALVDLTNSLSYDALPVDTQTSQSYGYEATGTFSFKLCADFNASSRVYHNVYSYRSSYDSRSVPLVQPTGKAMAPDNWQHGAGTVCFERTIDPSFYPPYQR